MTLDRSAAVPLYHQIFLELRDEILSGRRGFGTPVPTEADLAASYDVSRITARRALDELAQHGLVERRRRVGTTVTFRAPVRAIEANIDQAVDSLLAYGRATAVEVLDIAEEPADAAVAAALRLPEGEPIVRAVRRRSLDGEPIGLIVSHVPGALGSLVTREGLLRVPILELLAEAGHKPGAAEQTIAAMSADAMLATALSVEPRFPLLRIARTVANRAGDPILLTHAHYRADRYQIRLDLKSSMPRT